MKVGLVLSKTPAYSETFFLTKIKGLKVSGFEVILFAQRNDNDFSLCDVRLAPVVNKRNKLIQLLKVLVVLIELVIKSPKPFFKFIALEKSANRSLHQIVKNLYNNSHILKSDLDWVHFGFATMAIQSEHVAKAIGAKMGVSFRGFDLDVYPLSHANCYELLFKHVGKVHAISDYMLQQGYKLGLSKSKAFKIITPAINISTFKNENDPALMLNSILTVARLHWIKGLKDTIKAMALLKQKGIDFKYIIVGEGSEYNNLVELIITLQLTNHVFLVGKKSHDEVINYLKNTQMYIQYSESEGFCNAVLEAQAMGLLCVVSDGGALPENVLHEKTGWIFIVHHLYIKMVKYEIDRINKKIFCNTQ